MPRFFKSKAAQKASEDVKYALFIYLVNPPQSVALFQFIMASQDANAEAARSTDFKRFAVGCDREVGLRRILLS